MNGADFFSQWDALEYLDSPVGIRTLALGFCIETSHLAHQKIDPPSRAVFSSVDSLIAQKIVSLVDLSSWSSPRGTDASTSPMAVAFVGDGVKCVTTVSITPQWSQVRRYSQVQFAL
ncbi:hypothetical protein NL676_004063 [Syzygium grande]|nr:hypothetical protein NL676_004063 [Syzygium grande]